MRYLRTAELGGGPSWPDTGRPVPSHTPAGGRQVPRLRWSLSFIGVLIYVFAVTTYRLPIADLGIGIAIAGVLTESPKIKLPHFLTWFAFFVLWGALGLLWTIDRKATWDQVQYLAKLWLITFVFCNALRDEPKLRAYMLFTLLCFITHAGRGSIQNYLTGNTLFGRVVWNGEFANPNFLAGITLLELSLAVVLLSVERRTWARWFSLASIVLTVIVILATQSRSGFIGLVMFGILSLIAIEGRKRLRIAGAMAGLALIGVALAPKGVWERVGGLGRVSGSSDMRDVDPEGSAAERLRILQTGFTILGDHPMTGTGLKTYARTNLLYAPDLGRKDAHNTYMAVAVETGIPGLVLFLGMLVAAFRGEGTSRQRRVPRTPSVTWLRNGLLGFLIVALWGTVFTLQFLYLHMALLWAVLRVSRQQGSRSRSAEAWPAARPIEPGAPTQVIL